MKIHRLYVDQKGESHFEDVEITFVESSRSVRLSARLPATGIIFREVQPDCVNCTYSPYCGILGLFGVGFLLGEPRIGAGEVLLVEDTWGKGHLSKALDGKLRNCIFVPID